MHAAFAYTHKHTTLTKAREETQVVLAKFLLTARATSRLDVVRKMLVCVRAHAGRDGRPSRVLQYGSPSGRMAMLRISSCFSCVV